MSEKFPACQQLHK